MITLHKLSSPTLSNYYGNSLNISPAPGNDLRRVCYSKDLINYCNFPIVAKILIKLKGC